jgi:hypothetical protein
MKMRVDHTFQRKTRLKMGILGKRIVTIGTMIREKMEGLKLKLCILPNHE